MVVYTAAFGTIPGRLERPAKVKPNAGLTFVCFSDRQYLGEENPPWQVRPPLWSSPDPRRTIAYHKVLSHLAFPDVHYSLWLDVGLQLQADPWTLVERHLAGGVDVAAFQHRRRDCVYEEVAALAAAGDAEAAIGRRQVDGYREKGYPAHHGLAETSVLLRRHCPKVRELNQAWWGEIENGSARDQLSFDHAMWSRKMRYGQLKGRSDRSPYVRGVPAA